MTAAALRTCADIQGVLDKLRAQCTSGASAVHDILEDIAVSEALSAGSPPSSAQECGGIMAETLRDVITIAQQVLCEFGDTAAPGMTEEQQAWALGCVRFAQRHMRESRIIPAYLACSDETDIFCDATGCGPTTADDLDAVAAKLGGRLPENTGEGN